MTGPMLDRLMRKVMAALQDEPIDRAGKMYVLRCTLSGLAACVELDHPGSADVLADRIREDVPRLAAEIARRDAR